MLPTPSWKWLSSRLTTRALAIPGATPSRPCLPAIEQLDDRVMLSVSIEGAPKGDTQILIGLLRGQVELVSHEVNILKIAGDLKLDIHKFNESFLKIDDLIYKFGEDPIGTIKGESLALKLDKTINDLKIEFLKIDTLVGGLPEGSDRELKLLVDTFEHKATDLINFLGASTGGGDLEHKIEDTYLKVADSFLKLDGAVLKVEEDSIARKAGKGQQEYLKIKLEEVLVSSLKIDDGDLKQDLLGLASDTLATLGGNNTDTGGVTVETTDDVLA
jgi:hypothetical protein